MTALPELICPSGLPAAVATWRSQHRGEACLVICKATYRIEPGHMPLASEHDPIIGRDVHWDDDPGRSLRAASDFAVFKRRADVLVVGSAFAAPGAKVQRLVTYVSVAEFEKAIEVQPDRWVNTHDELQCGPPFSRMPLQWERAAHDEDGGNPVGRVASRDAYGRMHLPNLQPPAFEPRPPSWSIPAVGLGPIAPGWERRAGALSGPRKLAPGPSGALWPESWLHQGIPEDAQIAFFQTAPRDQQLDRLPTDASVLLEHLSPTSARLGTRLPGDRVRAFVGTERREIEIICDTLVIDTDRQIATLTWRGSYFAAIMPQVDRVHISFERREHQPEETVRVLVSEFRRPHSSPTLPFAEKAPAQRPSRAGLGSYADTPFGAGHGIAQKPELSAAPSAVPTNETREMPGLPAALESAWLGQTFLGASPTSDGPAPAQPASPSPAPIALPGPPPPVVRPPASVVPPAPTRAPGFPSSPPPARSARPPPGPSLPSYMVEARASVQSESVAHDAKATAAGVMSASNAAAERRTGPSELLADSPGKPRELQPSPRPAGYFDLLWFSDQVPERLRIQPGWSKLIRDGKGEMLTAKTRDGRVAEDSEALVARALARGAPLDAIGVGRAVLDAVDKEGFLVRPIVVVEGEVALSFDPVESLTVALSLSEPLASADRKFKEVHAATSELVAANRKVTLPMLEAGLALIRQAFAGAGKAYPLSYLEATAERWLVDERKYFKRTVLGQSRLVASIAPSGGGPPLPLFLPADLEQFLPTVPRLRARVLAEPHAKQDGAEGEPTSLVAMAFARVVGR